MKKLLLALCGSLLASSAFADDTYYGSSGIAFGNVDGGATVTCGPDGPELWWITSLFRGPLKDDYRVLWLKTPGMEYEPTVAYVAIRDGEMFSIVTDQNIIGTFGAKGEYRVAIDIDDMEITQTFHTDKPADVKTFIDNCNK